MTFTVFVSHAHEDSEFVEALQQVVEDTIDDVIIRSSSSRPTRGGIQPGARWLEWIHTSVSSSDATIVILTAASYNRPWLLWEAGAVDGIALSAGEDKPLIPVVYELTQNAIPEPLRHRQTVDGTLYDGIADILETIHGRVRRPSTDKFRNLVRTHVPSYLEKVRSLIDKRSSTLIDDTRFPIPGAAAPNVYDKTFQGEDLDLTVVNFTPRNDPDDMSGVTIVNGSGKWIIEIDVESPLRNQRHSVDMRFRRNSATAKGRVLFRINSGEIEENEEIIDLTTVRHQKYVVEYLIFRQVSRVAKVHIEPLDEEARQAGVFCLDSVSVYSLPRGGNSHPI